MTSQGQVVAWALYDFANTFFAVAMLSFHFPLWIVEDQGGKELWFSFALGSSMLVTALLMPWCGAVSDASGERMRFLRWTTCACAAVTWVIGQVSHTGIALALFGVANLCYQLGTVFYDALLWQISSGSELGRISGFGAAFGYTGSLCGLALLAPFIRTGHRQQAFAPAAALFLLFALPSFFLIRDPRHAPRSVAMPFQRLHHDALSRLMTTWRLVASRPGLARYFLATLFSASAINTILVFMGVYAKQTAGLTEERLVQFFLFSQPFAVAGSLVFGGALAHWGAKRTLERIWIGWALALGMLAYQPNGSWLWIAGPLIGFCLGSTWATARVLVVELAPKDHLAHMLGLAGLLGRLSSVLGPLVWGWLVWEPGRQRDALCAMIVFLVIGIWLLHGVQEPSTRAQRARG